MRGEKASPQRVRAQLTILHVALESGRRHRRWLYHFGLAPGVRAIIVGQSKVPVTCRYASLRATAVLRSTIILLTILR